MNAEIISILNKYGSSTIEQIRNNLSSTGTNATGKTSQSLRYEVTNEGTKATLKVIGKPYFAVVETGRKPTPGNKPSYEFVNNIKQWLAARGKDDKGAYGIAMSINKKGTKLFRDGGRKDIYSNVINQNLVDKINIDLLNKFAEQFLASAVKLFQDGSNSVGTSARTGS